MAKKTKTVKNTKEVTKNYLLVNCLDIHNSDDADYEVVLAKMRSGNFSFTKDEIALLIDRICDFAIKEFAKETFGKSGDTAIVTMSDHDTMYVTHVNSLFNVCSCDNCSEREVCLNTTNTEKKAGFLSRTWSKIKNLFKRNK